MIHRMSLHPRFAEVGPGISVSLDPYLLSSSSPILAHHSRPQNPRCWRRERKGVCQPGPSPKLPRKRSLFLQLWGCLTAIAASARMLKDKELSRTRLNHRCGGSKRPRLSVWMIKAVRILYNPF